MQELYELVDSTVTSVELVALVNVSVVLLGAFVIISAVVQGRTRGLTKTVQRIGQTLGHREVLLVSALSMVPQGSASKVVITHDSGIPVGSVVQPAFAIALLRRALRRHREDVSDFLVKNRLCEESAEKLSELRRFALEAHRQGVMADNVSGEKLDGSLEEMLSYEPIESCVVESWDILIRLYGYPFVQAKSGASAVFNKKRSVEVLAWLSMNMDRPRRSAVRTAIWDVEISDASFSTVMSDIRRGVSSIASERNREEIFPPTFTDSIEVGVEIVSDFELLRQALEKFRKNENCAQSLADELQLIRDIPFAGVNYMWADLDGTTTRLVLVALQASCELAEWARSRGDIEMCSLAVKAGLRVMPGHEELLAIQNSFISQRSMSQG